MKRLRKSTDDDSPHSTQKPENPFDMREKKRRKVGSSKPYPDEKRDESENSRQNALNLILRKTMESRGTNENDKKDDDSKIKVVRGDILEHKEDLLMHQVNCVATKFHGLSKQVFTKYPKANLYETRRKAQIGNGRFHGRDEAGTIEVYEDYGVINLIAQYYPGVSKYESDSKEKRYRWFISCIYNVCTYFDDRKISIAFPYRIGCGLAGGDWKKYLECLERYNKKFENVKFVMYRRDED